MTKEAAGKIYGVLGYPVKHSFSPAMHNAAFRALNIPAEYKLFEINPQDLDAFFGSLRQNNIFGLNVTIPYKEKVIAFLGAMSESAKLIGAVNTVKVSDQGLEGFNTDAEGFFKHLNEDLGFNPLGKNIAIIGAGGAARAVSVCLSQARPRKLSIYDLNKAKQSSLVNSLRENFKDFQINSANSIAELAIKECDLLINATPVGMKLADPCLINAAMIHKDFLVYDLIYNPRQTKLLKLAQEKGARVSNGLGMLLYQGMLAFEIWTGQKPPKEIMQKALEEAL
jgi:shikimate dehydrogenase